MYRHIRNSSLEAWCVRIPLTTVISAKVIIVETELYSNKSTLLKPLKLEWNVAVMKMKRFKWLGISEKTKFSGLLAKVLHRGVVSKLYERFLSVLPSFLLHSFTKRKQATAFKECKLRLKEDPSYAMMQFDFSQNMTCEWQDALMSTHWHKTQITILTCVIRHKANKFFKVKIRLSFWQPWA